MSSFQDGGQPSSHHDFKFPSSSHNRSESQKTITSYHPAHSYTQPNTSPYTNGSISQQQSTPSNSVQASINTQNELIEIITNLKVRIAVLENDLAHATKEKDDAIRSSVMIARTLGGIVNDPDRVVKKSNKADAEELEELRVKVRTLTRENRMLWGRIEDKGASGFAVLEDDKHEITSRAVHDFDASQQHSRRNDSYIASRKKVHEWDIPAYDEGEPEHHPAPFNTTTQLPHITNLEPPFPILRSNPKYNDVGLSSLSDVLDDAGSEKPENRPVDNVNADTEEPIDNQLLYQERALANFTNVPAPNVRKVGFSPETAVRGDDYAKRDYPNREAYYARFRNGPNYDPTNININQTSNMQLPSIFNSKQELDGQIAEHLRAGSREHRFPDFFRYGIAYVPSPGDQIQDVYRTVLISGLDKGVELRDVLKRVRGGKVYSSVLCDTMKLLGNISALVVFMEEKAARAYVEWVDENGISFEDDEDDEEEGKSKGKGKEKEKKITATLLNTPTYPLYHPKRLSISNQFRSRILSIRNLPTHISLRALEADITCRDGIRKNQLVEWYVDEYETLWMEFAGLDAAGTALAILGRRDLPWWRMGLNAGFEGDWCEGGLEELKEKVERRKPMFARAVVGYGEGVFVGGSENRRGSQELGKREYEERPNSREQELEGRNAVDSVVTLQRKRLANLQNQQVVIPSCRGEGLKSSAWADEVEDVEEDVESPAPRSSITSMSEVQGSGDGGRERLDGVGDAVEIGGEKENEIQSQLQHDSETTTAASTSTIIKEEPRIISATEYLNSLKPVTSPSQQQISPPISPQTPVTKQALTLSTAGLDNTVSPMQGSPTGLHSAVSRSTDSQEYSLHSFGSSPVEGNVDEGLKEKVQAQRQQTAQPQPQTKAQAVPQAKAQPDKKIYFLSGDTEKAIMDSETTTVDGSGVEDGISSAGDAGGEYEAGNPKQITGVNVIAEKGIGRSGETVVGVRDGKVAGGDENHEKAEGNGDMKKINPDEIDLDI